MPKPRRSGRPDHEGGDTVGERLAEILTDIGPALLEGARREMCATVAIEKAAKLLADTGRLPFYESKSALVRFNAEERKDEWGPEITIREPRIDRGAVRVSVLAAWQTMDADPNRRGSRANGYLRAVFRALGMPHNQIGSLMARLPPSSQENTQHLIDTGYADFFVQFCRVDPALKAAFEDLFRVYELFHASAVRAGLLRAEALTETAFALEIDKTLVYSEERGPDGGLETIRFDRLGSPRPNQGAETESGGVARRKVRVGIGLRGTLTELRAAIRNEPPRLVAADLFAGKFAGKFADS